jgi:hypothetical protein
MYTMMDGIRRVRKTAVLAALALSAGVLAGTANAQSTISANNFGGPDFATGDLNGQQGWVVDSGAATVVTGPLTPVSNGAYVQLGANTAASLAAPAPSGTNHVIVEGHYYGPGSQTLTAPSNGNPIAVLLGFRTVDANNIAIAAYDGDADDFVEPSGPVTFANNQWHQLTVAINYDDKTFAMAVNGQPHLQNVSFRDSSVASLNGIGVGSENGANVDAITLYASSPHGDFDGDGFTDAFEISQGTDPLTGTPPPNYLPGETPSFGDLNNDGSHDMDDVAILAQQIVDGTANLDITGSGTTNVEDVTAYALFASGQSPILK